MGDVIKNIKDISKFLDNIIMKAVMECVTDIHFEPRDKIFCIRYRIDGDLIDKVFLDNSFANTLISRIKIISNMDITIKRMPQDGRIDFFYENRKIDIRVASIPLVTGEKIVMRILNSSNFEIDIDNLGLYEIEKEVVRKIIKSPNGVILICGPTGELQQVQRFI